MTETLTARRAATRDRLVDAAIRVFAEKGVLGASVEEICEAAGFTRGAFYSNFSSKDDLCIAVLDRQISDQMSALDKALAAVDIAPTTDIDALMRVALEMFFASRPTDRDWVLTGQELRLHAARSPELALAYRETHRRGTEAVAGAISHALSTLGYELAVTGPEAVGALHAVHDHGMLGNLIGVDPADGDLTLNLLPSVLKALIRESGGPQPQG